MKPQSAAGLPLIIEGSGIIEAGTVPHYARLAVDLPGSSDSGL